MAMINCHRVLTINLDNNILKLLSKQQPVVTQLKCSFCSSKDAKDKEAKELKPFQDESSLLNKDSHKLNVSKVEEDTELEPTRDNRLLPKRWSIKDVNNYLPTVWVDKCITLKNNYFYPPVTTVFKKDGISRARYTICYRAEFVRLYIGWAAVMTPFVVLATTALGLYSIFGDFSDSPNYDPYDFDSSTATAVVVMMAGLYYFLAWQYLVRMKVIRMYYSKDAKDFIIVYFNPWNPYWIRKIKCKAGEAKLIKGLFVNTDINGKKFLIGADNFSFSIYFNVLYGYKDPKDIEKLINTMGNESADSFLRGKKESMRSNIYNIYK